MMIFLDAILDTRLAVMASVRKDIPVRVIKTLKYMDRDTDRFTDILKSFPQLDYDNKWKSRTKDDIKSECFPTYLLPFISEMVDDIKREGMSTPIQGEVEITINTAPYHLDESGKEALKEMSLYHFGVDAEIVNIPIDFLHPDTLRGNYDDVFIYEFDKWLNIHFDAIKEKPCPSLHIYAPLLTVKKPDKKYDIMKDKAFMETSLAAYMSLRYLSSGTFSMIPPKIAPEEEQ